MSDLIVNHLLIRVKVGYVILCWQHQPNPTRPNVTNDFYYYILNTPNQTYKIYEDHHP